MDPLIKAFAFAADKHKHQRRKNTEAIPYINHPIDVTALLSKAGITDEDVLIAGVLHDTIEDTQTSYEEIVEDFGRDIADIVKECTDNKSLPKVTRKKLQIENASHKSFDAKLVKLADKLSNLSDLYHDPPVDWSKEIIHGYFVWSFCVCREVKGTNDYLEDNLWKIFDQMGISSLDEEKIQEELQKYYSML